MWNAWPLYHDSLTETLQWTLICPFVRLIDWGVPKLAWIMPEKYFINVSSCSKIWAEDDEGTAIVCWSSLFISVIPSTQTAATTLLQRCEMWYYLGTVNCNVCVIMSQKEIRRDSVFQYSKIHISIDFLWSYTWIYGISVFPFYWDKLLLHASCAHNVDGSECEPLEIKRTGNE